MLHPFHLRNVCACSVCVLQKQVTQPEEAVWRQLLSWCVRHDVAGALEAPDLASPQPC